MSATPSRSPGRAHELDGPPRCVILGICDELSYRGYVDWRTVRRSREFIADEFVEALWELAGTRQWRRETVFRARKLNYAMKLVFPCDCRKSRVI